MTPTISRHAAQKLRLAAQTTAGVVVLGSIALAAMVPGGAPQPREIIDDGPILPIANGEQAAQSDFRFDERSVADRLAMLDNAPRIKGPVVVTIETPVDPTTTPPVDPEGLADRIKFLGTMSVGTKKMALVSVDNRRQRVVSVGNALPMPADESGVTLREAADTEIIVTDRDGVSIRIGLEAPEEKPRVSTLAASPSAALTSLQSTSPGMASRGDRGGRGGQSRAVPDSVAYTAEVAPSDAIERRRKALQAAVEKGTLTQERADEMMERAMDNARKNARQNPGRRED
ncbi:MAG: hypothetical protein ACI89L_002230 [Phycisphaerales bacterium]|jgi:hypothetical protein